MIQNSRKIKNFINWIVSIILLTYLAVKLPVYLLTVEIWLIHPSRIDLVARISRCKTMQELSQKIMSFSVVSAFFFRGDKTVYIAEKVTLKSNSEGKKKNKTALTGNISRDCRNCSVKTRPTSFA